MTNVPFPMIAPSDRASRIRSALVSNVLFRTADPTALNGLIRRARLDAFEAAAIVCRKGDPAHTISVVASGILRVSALSKDGRQVVFGLMEPGMLFGEVALFCEGGRSADALALVPSSLVTIPRADFVAFLAHNPNAVTELLRGMAERIRHLSDHVVEARFTALPERLQRTLLALSRLEADGVVRASQTSLADMALASREIVNRQLNAWRKSELIELKRKAITLSARFKAMCETQEMDALKHN